MYDLDKLIELCDQIVESPTPIEDLCTARGIDPDDLGELMARFALAQQLAGLQAMLTEGPRGASQQIMISLYAAFELGYRVCLDTEMDRIKSA